MDFTRAKWRRIPKAFARIKKSIVNIGGGDYRHEMIIMEELVKANVDGFGLSLHNAIVAPYILNFGTEEQKQKWLPRMASGELVGAIAMSEPGTGSDLQNIKTNAKKDGNGWVVNGSKTFITNGGTANLVLVVADTGGEGKHSKSIFVVETDDLEGFRRGRILDKVGMDAQDTAELFFDDMKLPADALLGPEPGHGFIQLMKELPQERLNIAVQGVAQMEAALETTIEYRPSNIVKSAKPLAAQFWGSRTRNSSSRNVKPLSILPRHLSMTARRNICAESWIRSRPLWRNIGSRIKNVKSLTAACNSTADMVS